MGAKTWMLVFSDGNAKDILKAKPELNRAKSEELAKLLFPSVKLERIEDGDLSFTSPPDDEIYVGCYPGLSIIAAAEFGIDYPSRLPVSFLDKNIGSTIYLHAMHSVVDWFAFAVWENGELKRSLSLSPDSGILEDTGNKLKFEEAYWAGKHPAIDPEDEEEEYPFPFHPLELGEAALGEFFGYQLEGYIDPSMIEPEEIPLVTFKRRKAKWKFW
jgi:hypothetical protein